LAKVGGCPFIEWVRWEAMLVEEEEEEIKPSRVGEKMKRDALMVRRSLREEESFILVDLHGHGRPWSLG
jgi:hypothetical protein